MNQSINLMTNRMHEMNVMNSEAAVDLPVSSKLTGYRGFFFPCCFINFDSLVFFFSDIL